ncbi:SGNH/GDSL hydrolase family protein [Litoribaculum gwangyangense]|uniref:SGNH/GDSL hydrolase family protein n=1 Tax=Litoribaculum gwangyangense TaxID=1130722 RepID=A0ABP9CFU4_9FLAO
MNKICVIMLLSIFPLTSCSKNKPKILIIGDSISIGYTPFVKQHFSNKAIVFHNEGNAQHTGTGLEKIEEWLGDEPWDIIQFNWGLWDLCYRHPNSKEYGQRDKMNGNPEFSAADYASNLEALVAIIKKKSNAKLIFVTTTYVPKNEPGRFEKDVEKYNDVAKSVMRKHNIAINDIYIPSIGIHKENGLGEKDVHYTEKGYEELSKLIIKFLNTTI